NFLRYHRLVNYLGQYTSKPIGLPLGIARLRDVLDEKFYIGMDGGLLESLGQLFRSGVKLYAFPSLDRAGKLTTADNLEVAPHLRHLYAHLLENKLVEKISDYNPDCLSTYSNDVLTKIQSGDSSWESQVPRQIAEAIRAKGLFGYGSL
ncbi:MAG: hypothetical protein ACI8UO_005530, partial [Verrucomicrobiales bacterium]